MENELHEILSRCYICFMEIDSENCDGCERKERLVQLMGKEAEKKHAPYQWFERR